MKWAYNKLSLHSRELVGIQSVKLYGDTAGFLKLNNQYSFLSFKKNSLWAFIILKWFTIFDILHLSNPAVIVLGRKEYGPLNQEKCMPIKNHF